MQSPLLRRSLLPSTSRGLQELVSFQHVVQPYGQERCSFVIDAANEVVDSVDRDELAKNFTLRSDPDDEEAEKIKKKMETTRDQLAEALYQKGLALAEIESLQVGIVNFFRSTFMVI
nr:tripeptidyl-peptidase 2-like [Malus domestica]